MGGSGVVGWVKWRKGVGRKEEGKKRALKEKERN